MVGINEIIIFKMQDANEYTVYKLHNNLLHFLNKINYQVYFLFNIDLKKFEPIVGMVTK